MIELGAQTIAEFMRALLVTEPHFPANTWYFRGQGDSAWGVVPTSRREDAWKPFGGAARHGLVCRNGLVVSADRELREVESRLEQVLTQVIHRRGLPPHLAEADALSAFARHIGLPTRLLDWTRSPWTAAYFAAAEAAQKFDRPGTFAVYAMSASFAQHSSRMENIELLNFGAAGNPNLVAQQAVLFRLVGDQADLVHGFKFTQKPIGYRPTEEEARVVDSQFVRITLPWRLAPGLLETLRAQEMHAASMYPDNRGIAELVREVFLTEASRNDQTR